MSIKNKNLKTYINSNTSPSIRRRGRDMIVKIVTFAEKNTSAQAIVLGSRGDKYVVNFENLQSGHISSSCTCPFDWGNVCKHEVAVAFEIDHLLDHPAEIVKHQISPKKKASYKGVIEIPFTGVEDITDQYIMEHAGLSVYNSMHYGYSQITIENTTPHFIYLLVEEYYNDRKIIIEKKKDSLALQCDCSTAKSNLCVHLAKSLLYIANNLPHVFLSEEELNSLKEKKLNEYGFSLKDEVYKQYFSFNHSENGLEISSKEKGIVRMSEHGDFNFMLDELVTGENVLKQDLPYKEKEIERKKQKAIAFGFFFGDPLKEEPSIIVTPLIGNLNKDKNDLTTKIEKISPEELIYNEHDLSKEDKELLQIAFNLSEERVSELTFRLNRDEDNLVIEKHLFTQLKVLLPALENKLVYEMTNEWKLSRKTLAPIELKTEHTDLAFKVIEEPHFYLLKSYVVVGGTKYQMANKPIANNSLFIKHKGIYYFNKSISYAKALQFFRQNPEIRINKIDFENYHREFIKPLSKKYNVEIVHLKTKSKSIPSDQMKKQLYLSDLNGFILFRPMLEYNDQQIEVLSNATFEEHKNGKIYNIKREEFFDQEFIETIKGLHPNFLNQTQAFYYLSPDEFLKDVWFIDAFDVLEKEGISVFGFDTLSGIKYNKNKPTISVKVNSGLDWFDVNMDVSFGKQLVSLKELKKVVMNKSRYVELKDGSVGILPEKWLEKYTHLFRSGDVQKDKISVSKYQLSVIDSLYDELDSGSELLKNHIAIKQKLKTFKEITKVKEPKGVTAKLRDYQKEGLNWLNFLDQHSFGGCLADDMGLGKTLQIITFFKHLKNDKNNKNKNAHLIVLPTSLIFNWQEEIKKFCPTLKVLVLTGSDRNKTTKGFDKFDLVLTTYGIALRDVEYLKKYTFHYIVLDESQAIKNPESKRFKAVRLLQASNRLVLTGTPIENNTFDLFAQMTFVNPGLLGTITSFRNEYANRIDKNKDSQVANELKQLINPFLLRRTKEQVATELPSKTEQTLYCTMESDQQKLYDAYKNKYRDYLLGKIEEDGLGKSKMYVLEGLTKLRQICDAPTLLNEDEIYTTESIKIKELLKHITEKTGDHKILVFSQFVKMLHLIEDEFKKENINYEYLDGKTKNRQEKVERFQNNDQVRVFLISLKAGGTGLNLTAADYVYLVDPWWNPAVEAQAIDRCYRIGQTKKVMAYKMICKGTVEEKIMQHQQNKKQLSADIIQTDESYMKELSKESIEELFS